MALGRHVPLPSQPLPLQWPLRTHWTFFITVLPLSTGAQELLWGQDAESVDKSRWGEVVGAREPREPPGPRMRLGQHRPV